MHLRRLAGTLVLLSALAPTTAWAQAADSQASAANKATARDLTIQGYSALEKKDYTTALDLLGRANALYHAPTVLIGLARANLALGKLMTAREFFNQVAHEPVPAGAPPAFLRAVEDSVKELAALSGRVPGVVLNVKWTGPATVVLDGTEVPSASLGIRRAIDPGKHLIKVFAPGAADSEMSIVVAEGKTETVTIELKAGAGTAPVAAPKDTRGGFGSSLSTPESPPSNTRKVVAYGALGAGAVGLIVGGIGGGLAMSKNSELAKQCPGGHCLPSQQATLQSKISSYQTMETLSTAGFIAGGALAATGVILWLTAPKTASAAVTPVVGLGYLGAQGSF